MDVRNLDENQIFDLIIKDIGGFGLFQKSLLFLSIFASLVAACNHLSPIYLTYTPDFQCADNNTIQNEVRILYLSEKF